ncbi:sugar kinase [Cryobacterium frigoriphilum]|uniref:Sugar kinase n=1 Tax=Cryobacterium frigoriphilum TaxID=1259150 RepID=A0A4R9A7Y9_9MICO|nr:sugar kinase [Cryobacterium frigoriphilum]TFD53554.1 sugar kinase [Cryobacterium frigoriphilum]
MTLPEIRPASACRFDAVSLGEVMLRLDPGEGRIRTARSFTVWEGGGEYNVARGLSRTFGLRTSVVTALVDNELGRLTENLILAGGVDTSLIQWRDFDGVGREVRNALNFVERGFGLRGAMGVSDRGHSAASQLTPAGVDWDHLFGTLGVRWLHTGGIFAGLSESSAETAMAAMTAARRHGTLVSVDLNFRPSLWANGADADGTDSRRARRVFTELAEHADVLIGGSTDFTDRLGIADPVLDGAGTGTAAADRLDLLAQRVLERFTGVSVVASTVRRVVSASVNDWSVVAHDRTGARIASTRYDGLEILDRVGGGDGFVSGLAYALLAGLPLDVAVNYGTAHGALAMTTPGDNSMATLAEVAALVSGAGSHVTR